jgi:hypothetical protein
MSLGQKSSKTERREEALADLRKAAQALIAAAEGLPSMLAEDGATVEQVQCLFRLLAVEIETTRDFVESSV